MSNLITDVSKDFSYVSEEGGVDLDLAHFHFKRLCALSEQDRVNFGAGVRDYWSSVEDTVLAEYPSILAETQSMYETDPAAAAEFITNYTIDLQDKALADAKLMFDELTWYMITNTTLDPANITPFVPSIAEAAEEVEEAA